MVNDRQAVASLLPEPPDGARLVVQTGDHEYKVIWRDDADAAPYNGGVETQRWFDEEGSDPMELYQHVKYVQAVWRLDGAPVAVFNGKAF
jgi:hypothetical protein